MGDELQKVIDFYNKIDENERLFKDKTHKIEYLTTIEYLNKLIKSGDKMLDVGAGTGVYSFYFANKNIDVTAIELVQKNVDIIKLKNVDNKINVLQGDARDLTNFENNSFDIVLCLGPLYHLEKESDKLKCIKECLRVLKKDGYLVIAYISKYAHFLKMVNGNYIEKLNLDILKQNIELGKEDGKSFNYLSPKQVDDLISRFPIKCIFHLGTDGISYMLEDKINNFSDEQFDVWFKYHLQTCEEKSVLGYSLHCLNICKKL